MKLEKSQTCKITSIMNANCRQTQICFLPIKHLFEMIPVPLSHTNRKSVLRPMRTTMAQISLRIRALWSAPLLFAGMIAWLLKLLYTESQASEHLMRLSRLVWVLPGRNPPNTGFLVTGLIFLPTIFNNYFLLLLSVVLLLVERKLEK